MVRIGAIFIVACMALIAGSLAFVLYFRFDLGAAESGLVGLGALTTLALYSGVSGRKQDRTETSDQVASLARGADDLARQLAEFGRRLNIMRRSSEPFSTRRWRPRSRWPRRSKSFRAWSRNLPRRWPPMTRRWRAPAWRCRPSVPWRRRRRRR